MKRMAILTWLAILSCWIANAQPKVLNTYTFVCDTTPSSAAAACTVQQPATGAKRVQFLDAFVYSAAALDVTLSRDGTAATATAGSVAKVNAGAATTTVSVFSASDVGSGTTISKVPLPAGGSVVLDLQDIQMIGAGTAKNLSLKTGTTSSRVLIIFRWRESDN